MWIVDPVCVNMGQEYFKYIQWTEWGERGRDRWREMERHGERERETESEKRIEI